MKVQDGIYNGTACEVREQVNDQYLIFEIGEKTVQWVPKKDVKLVAGNQQLELIQDSLRCRYPLQETSIYPNAKRTYLGYRCVNTLEGEGQEVAVIYAQVITGRLQQAIVSECNRAGVPYIVV